MPHDFGPAEQANASTLMDLALAEDLGARGDLTALLTIPGQARGSARFVSRGAGVIAGLPVVALLADRFELAGHWETFVDDGQQVEPGTAVARVSGPLRSLLTMERTGAQLPSAAERDRHAHRPVRGRGGGHEGADPRYPQDHTRVAGP